MDFRLTPAVEEYFRVNGLSGNADMISVAGAAKGMADQENSFLESQIDLSKRLHGIQTVILMNHTDCGAYGGRSGFSSSEAERERHLDDLRTAKERIQHKDADLEVRLIFGTIGEDGKVVVEEIAS